MRPEPRLGPKKREHGEHAAMIFGGGREPQLSEDVGDVLLDRALGDDEPLGDGLNGPRPSRSA